MTAQASDVLKYGGAEWLVRCSLSIPRDFMVEAECDNTDIYGSTCCWRGYVATWRINGDVLELLSMEGKFRLIDEKPRIATWLDCPLKIARGDVVEYVHMGYLSRFEYERNLWCYNGTLYFTRDDWIEAGPWTRRWLTKFKIMIIRGFFKLVDLMTRAKH
jgi:hypothetical protein